MKQNVTVKKGMKLLIRRMVAKKLGSYSIAGNQMKIVVEKEEFEGVVTHIRGDHPTHPKLIDIVVKRADGTETTVASDDVAAVILED